MTPADLLTCASQQTQFGRGASAGIDQPKSILSPKKGHRPAPIPGISKITIKVVVFHFRCFQLPLILRV
nr:putative disease resistance protein [Trifolium alexandrinum]